MNTLIRPAHGSPAEPGPQDRGTYKIPALRALSEITASLGTDVNVEDLLARFLGTMIRLAGAAAGAVRVVTPDGGHLRLVGALGLPPEVVEQERCVPLNCGICGLAAAGDAILVQPAAEACRDGASRGYLGERYRQVVAVPLRHRGRVMGVYNLFLPAGGPIPEEVSLLFSSISEHLGMALENARLAQENLRITLMNERQMLANEVHDSLAQTLAYMKMRLAFLAEAVRNGDDPLAGKYLGDVEQAMDSAYGRLRHLLTHFRDRIDPRGLVAALQDLAAGFSAQSGIHTSLVSRAPEPHLSPEQELHVYRIVSEALTNVSKHSRARSVRVTVDMTGDRYVISVEDDGIGLGASAEQRIGMQFGLNIMRERAQRLGGELHVEQRVGEGTRVRLEFPQPGAVSGAAP
ncbi:MAG: ATP-binding protein [Pseudomonadota bacterium]